jgi:hypothetical protein
MAKNIVFLNENFGSKTACNKKNIMNRKSGDQKALKKRGKNKKPIRDRTLFINKKCLINLT